MPKQGLQYYKLLYADKPFDRQIKFVVTVIWHEINFSVSHPWHQIKFSVSNPWHQIKFDRLLFRRLPTV